MPIQDEAPPTWENSQELADDSAPPSWEDTSEYVEPSSEPIRPQRVRSAINQTIQAVYRPLDLLTNPAVVAGSQMGQERAKRAREAQMGVVAPGSFFPVPQPLAEPTPEDRAAGSELVRSITSVPGRVLAAGARTVRDVLSPSTYLPEDMKAPPPFVINTRGEQPELRQMTRAEEATRDPLQGPRALIPVRGTQLEPEGSEGAQLLSGLSTPDNIGIIAAGGASKIAGMALLFSMAPGIYEDVKRIASSDVPLEQKRQSINNLLIPLVLGAKGAYERPIPETPQLVGPPAMGSTLRTPGGFYPEGRSAELVGPPVTDRFRRPEVPGTPAETRMTAKEEVRAANARTKAEIKALFPQLTNEQARDLAIQVWGTAGDFGVVVSPTIPRPEPIADRPEIVRPPGAPPPSDFEVEQAARIAEEQRVAQQRRDYIDQMVITQQRELDKALEAGDKIAERNAAQRLMELKRARDFPPAPAKGPIVPKPPLPNLPRGTFRPEVPGTAAEPYETVLATIRKAGARTRKQIQALFPERRLKNEEAADLRDAAWGAQPQPEPPAAAPEPTAAAPKWEETTEPPKGGEEPLPPEEPTGTTVPKPPTPPTPAGEGAVKSVPTPPADVDYTDLEQANKLSGQELVDLVRSKGSGITEASYELGAKLTPETRAKARQYEEAANAETMAVLQEAQKLAPRSLERLKASEGAFAMQQKKQLFNEAGRFYDAIQDVKNGKDLAQAAVEHGVKETDLRRVAEAAPAEAAATLTPKPGMTRLYHGEGAAEGAGAGGGWFTENPEYAAQFGKVTFVDVPKEVADAARQAARNTGTGGPHFILPDEYVKQAQPMATQPGPKTFDVTPEEPPKPETPAAPAGPDPLDKVTLAMLPLKQWMKVTKTDQLPTGYEFTMMAKRLGVKRDRKAVLEALHNEKRLREIFKPFEQPKTAATAEAPTPAPAALAGKTLKGTYLRDFPEGTKIQRGNETLTIIKQKKNSTMVGTAGDPTGYEMSWSADGGNWEKAKPAEVSTKVVGPETKPAEPEAPKTEPKPAEPETEAPPPVPFEGPTVGSPEAQSVLERADSADTRVSDLYTKLSDAEEELKKTKYGTKKQEALERKVEKLRDQHSEASRETKLIRQGARLLRLRELAETGDPAQRWAASAEYARKIAGIADDQLAELRDKGGGGSGDTFYWQVVDRARRFGAIAKEISDKGYALFTEKVSKQLQDLGATKEEADFQAGQIVNMQFSYPGMTSVKDAPLRMHTISLERLRADTVKKAEALKEEFGVLHDTGFERRAREVTDEKSAGALLAEHREEYQRRKTEVERQAKAKATAAQEAQANEITRAKNIDPEKLRWYYDNGTWRAVEGKTVKVPIAPEYEFFVHKNPRGGGYNVTEASTGLRVGNGDSHKAAIADANQRLTGIDPGDVTRQKKIAELIRKQIPTEPRPLGPEAIGPGSAARLEFEGPEFEPPDPGAIGLSAGSPFFNRLKAKYQHFYQGISQLFKRSADKQILMQLANAADNLPRLAGHRAGQGIRERTSAPDRSALTFVMQALKMSGEGLSAESAERLGELEFAGDPGAYLRTKATDMETLAQQFLHEGKKLNAEAAIAAAKAMRFAVRNFARLRPLADTVRAQFDKQFEREGRAGISTDYENWHVPQRHDLDLMTSSDRPIVLGHSRAAGTATGFKKAKVYEDYATAIENGFVPRSLDIADLLEHRVNQGERLVQRKALFDRLRAMTDPVDGKSLAQPIPRRSIPRPDGTVDVQEHIPLGYQPFEVIPGYRMAVHEGYGRLMRALTGTSQLAESAAVGALQDIAGIEKHISLALDTFHASRTMQAELSLTGKLSVGARQRLGRALVEYNLGDLQAAVSNGSITQEMADYIKTPRPIEVGGRTIRLSPHALVQLGAREGLNLARFNDALYRDWIREFPVSGKVNKWVFDKLTRSAITHGFLAEFERVAKQNPQLNATQVARKVASDVNVLFGNLQKESIFRNPSVKSILQVLFLAPNWVEALVRREGRALKQVAEIPVQIAKGQPVHFGTAAKGIGSGLAAYFVGTQLLNLITRGHLTFSNEEKGHKLDAWIPDVTGKTKGYFISPLSVFGEVTHDILRYAREKPDLWAAVNQIGSNKMGNLGRLLEVMISGRDPANNEKLIGTGRRAITAATQLVPVPISLSQAGRAGGSKVLPGVIPPAAPGSVQRQIVASAGFKTEPAGTAQRQIYALADEWKSKSSSAKLRAEVERRLKEDFGPSDYADLRGALLRDDLGAARRAFDELRKTKEAQVINRALRHPHPFTGSAASERSFIRSLSDHNKALYKEALEERKQLYSRYRQMLNRPE